MYRPPQPREMRRRLNANEAVCRDEFEDQCLKFQYSGIRRPATPYVRGRQGANQDQQSGRSSSANPSRKRGNSKSSSAKGTDRSESRSRDAKRKCDVHAGERKTQKRSSTDSPSESRGHERDDQREEDPRNILPLSVTTEEQYPFHARPPANPDRRGENDCRVVANFKLPYREKDFLSERVRPIEEADLARENSGARWIIGDEIAATRSVHFDTLSTAATPPHGIDPLGRTFVYLRITNVQRTPGWENQDQIARVYPVLVRSAAGKNWLLHGWAYTRRCNWYAILKKTRPPFSRANLEPTTETYQQEKAQGSGPIINQISGFEARLRPQGYPIDTFLAGLNVRKLQQWSAHPDRTTHYGLPLVLRNPTLV